MTEDNGVQPDITEDTPQEDSSIVNIPDAIGPNVQFSISPQGLIRCSFAAGVLMSAFYCDLTAARIISQQLADVADKLEVAMEELQLLAEQPDTVEDDRTLRLVEPGGDVDEAEVAAVGTMN